VTSSSPPPVPPPEHLSPDEEMTTKVISVFSIPNLVTSGNILCGNIALAAIVSQHDWLVPWMVMLGCVFDFLDGFVARWLHKYSEVGLQLDSLADMSSFGIVPAVFTYVSHGRPLFSLIVHGTDIYLIVMSPPLLCTHQSCAGLLMSLDALAGS
jgi:CDP-diacylglycerol--serine O-phosphatidyltransferase